MPARSSMWAAWLPTPCTNQMMHIRSEARVILTGFVFHMKAASWLTDARAARHGNFHSDFRGRRQAQAICSRWHQDLRRGR